MVVPEGCTSVDVFLVGGGGGGSDGTGGYTKTYKNQSVNPGSTIVINVGSGSVYPYSGQPSSFGPSCQVSGGNPGGRNTNGGSGGFGGGAAYALGGSDGGKGGDNITSGKYGGAGQGTTTRDFGEASGLRNAGGGGGETGSGTMPGGVSDYSEGKGGDGNNFPKQALGGKGYGGARGGSTKGGKGGDGTVLIRYYAYRE